MGGNLNLPRLAARGVIEPTGKVKREPKRYAVADRKAEFAGPAVETLRSKFTCEPTNLQAFSVPVRAVLYAKGATCRYVYGDEPDDFTFCGDKATVIRGGALTYCQTCAKKLPFDMRAWKAQQDAMRAAGVVR